MDSQTENKHDQIDNTFADTLVEAFALAVGEIRRAEDAVIAEPTHENVIAMIAALDDFHLLRDTLSRATRLGQVLAATGVL